jgi:hypothetical protein
MGLSETQAKVQVYATMFRSMSQTDQVYANNQHDIMQSMLPDLQLEDIVRLRKPHPCGSYEWLIVRLGTDIGLECQGCGRRVLLPRRTLARRLKSITASDQKVQPGT